MPLLRVLVAWLLAVALPLQGLAATSMLLCGQAPATSPAWHEAHPAHADGHAHQHGHASASTDAAVPVHEHAGHSGTAAQADADHACGLCAACCSLLALAELQLSFGSADPPSAALAQPQGRIVTRVPPRPDKPPRA